MREPDERRPLEKPRNRWEEDNETDLQEIGWEAWI
jgi:hypothetical protein